MSATISTRWFFSDWMSDSGVRASSLAARGLWKDMLCIAGMNKGDDYGYVLLNGNVPTTPELARMIGASEQEVAPLLEELERKGVFNRDRRRAIYCRRMVRAEKSRRNGRLGGNPNLLKDNRNQNQVQPHPKARIPEPIPNELPIGSSAPLMAGPEGLDARTKLFRCGAPVLMHLTGKLDGQCRKLIAKWLRDSLDDAVAVLRAIEDADRNRVAEPVSWIEAALRSRDGRSTATRRIGNAFAAMAAAGVIERHEEML